MHLTSQSIIILTTIKIICSNIVCEFGKDCTIDKYNQNNKIINAQNATSLTLNCYNKSFGLSIYCPAGECNIICHDEQSCEYAVITTYNNTKLDVQSLSKNAAHSLLIYGDNAYKISLICQADKSCDYASVHAPNAININIFCATRPSYSESCSHLKLYAGNADHVNLTCGDGSFADDISAGSCRDTKLYADNAGSVNIIAYDIAYALIKAQHANHLSLTCISRWRYDGCYNTEILFPNSTQSGVTTFNCYGSCHILNIYGIKCDVLFAMDISLNGCSLSQRYRVYDFITMWSFHLLLTENELGPQNAITTVGRDSFICWPWQDDRFIADCNCSDIVDFVTDLFVNDASMQGCELIIDGTLSPTVFPAVSTTPKPTFISTGNYTSAAPTLFPTVSTTQRPTYIPTGYYYYTSVEPTVYANATNVTSESVGNGASVKSNITVEVGLIIVAVVIGSIVIGIIIYFIRRPLCGKNKHQKVMVTDNENDADVNHVHSQLEHVPITQNFQIDSTVC